jgi:hypothetical protein
MSPTEKITQLTDEERARFGEFADRWTRIGLCTDPADRLFAEAAIRQMYRQGGLELPQAMADFKLPYAPPVDSAAVVIKKANQSGEDVTMMIKGSRGESDPR